MPETTRDRISTRWLLPAAAFFFLVAAAPALAEEATAAPARGAGTWLSLLPPALAIVLALAFRQVLPALFAGVWVGGWIVYGGPLVGLMHTLDRTIIQALYNTDRLSILVFSLALGGMVGVISRSGGTIGLVEALAPYATTPRRGQLVSWLMGILIFFDDYANTLLVGSTMRPVTDRLRVSREKLAYIVDSTAAPVASIALVSTWIGYEVSLIGESLTEIGSSLDPYTVFIRSLPYNFYPLLALVFGLAVAVSRRDFGPMLAAERRALGGKVLGDDAVPLADFDAESLAAPEGKPRRWFNAALPIVTVLAVTFVAQWLTGRASLAAEGYVRGDAPLFKHVGDVFAAGNSFKALLWASMAGALVAIALAVAQRILTFGEATTAWVNGVKSMLMAVLILTLAWAIGDICSQLDTKTFIVEGLSDHLDPRLLPAIVFLLASLTAFSTGTSWATMGILIPLAVPAAVALAREAGFVEPVTTRILLGSVSAVLAGAIFGDHCSPISDTTVMSSMASGCDHVDHVRTQLPYALAVAGVALVFGYVPAGYGLSPLIGLPLAALVLVGGLFWIGRHTDRTP